MSFSAALALTPREVWRFRPHEAVVYTALVAWFERTGLWRYPVRASGDLETMRFLDKVYWLYKAGCPIRHGVRGAGLEAHFEANRSHVWRLPPGFRSDQEARVSAVGDLMNHAYLASSADTLYPRVRELIFGVDLAMANLECVVRESPAGSLQIDARSAPTLSLDPRSLDVVAGHGPKRYALMATACNHSLDFGVEGVRSTIEALRARQIAFAGLNECEEDAQAMTVLDANGIRVGVLSFTFGLNAHQPPADRPRLVNRMRLDARPAEVDFAQLEAQLAHGRRTQVDFVVAQLHWGMEFELYPRPEQLELAHHLAELGVDAIIGHHPHVLQPVESYWTRRDPDRVVPIFYSLGNLTNPFSAPYLCRSGVARVELARGTTVDGRPRTYVKAASLAEVVQVADPVRRKLFLEPA